MENTIYLVTGAAGFLGSTICRQLVKKGEKVRGFVLPNDPAAKYLPEEVEVVYGDLCNKESIERFFAVDEGKETVCLHIASIVTVEPEFNQKVVDVNVGGTNNIIDAVLAHPECKKWSIAVPPAQFPKHPKALPSRKFTNLSRKNLSTVTARPKHRPPRTFLMR